MNNDDKMYPATILNKVINQGVDNQHTHGVIHKDFNIEDMEQYMPEPVRIRQEFKATSLDGFIDYVEAFKGEHSRLFGVMQGKWKGGALEPTRPMLKAALDFHAPGKPSHCTHNALFIMADSQEFLKWQAIVHAGNISQSDFAEIIQEHEKDIVSPDVADLMQIGRYLQASKTVHFESGVTLANGSKEFVVRESTTVLGEMEIPATITIFIPIFEGMESDKLTLFLRYRLDGENRLSFSLAFKNLEDTKRAAIDASFMAVHEATGLDIIEGVLID